MIALSLSIALVSGAVSPTAPAYRPAPVLVAQAEYREPPAPMAERVPPPRAGWVWIPGMQEWNGRRYQWVRGHWERERRGHRWEPAHWDMRGGVRVWVPGAWIEIGGAPPPPPAPVIVEPPPPPPPQVETVPPPRPGWVWI